MQMELCFVCVGGGSGDRVSLLSVSLTKKGQVFIPDPALLFVT